MPKNKDMKGPQFVQYFGPVVDALKQLGGSGRPSEVKDLIATQLRLSDEALDETIESRDSRFSNQVDWARFYLSKAGYIGSSTRGVWSLTDIGRSSSLTRSDSIELAKRVRKGFGEAKTARKEEDELEPEDIEVVNDADYRSKLMALLRKLSPSGFESLCQELLREAGFESVTVTGKSGDGGIDGIGILQLNPLVSFKVLFQCKRYSGTIGTDKIRDFRGAMMGRTEKGIFLTTGTFTADAKREAVRDGVPPIELVDSDKLLDMFEELEFGLRPKRTFEIKREFFAKFE